LLTARPAPAEPDYHVTRLECLVSRYKRSNSYLAALATPGAKRHSLTGAPNMPVKGDHQRSARRELVLRQKRGQAVVQALDAAP
jgi:hypothetical protein